MEVLIIILILAFIQSIFGVGLLVFGTPLLLILNYDFFSILGILLPSSLIISLLQINNILNVIKEETKSFITAIIGISFGLLLNKLIINNYSLFILIFVLTMTASILKTFPRYKIFQFKFLIKLKNIFHLGNGIIHGVTNMGGVLLPIFSNLKDPSKHSVNYNAYFYSLYVFIQIVWLVIFEKFDYIINGLFYMPIAVIVYFVFGNQTLNKINNKTYNNLITIFFWSLTFAVVFKLIKFFY